MPPAYEVLLLNTAVPQIQAAQSGDTYVVPRDIAFSAALTLSAGTANGVPYLNGSKVLTSGSALTFDGTALGMSNGGAVNIGGNVSLYGDANQTVIRGRTTNGIIFQDQAGTGEWMRLTSTGLGIGTSSPISYARLTLEKSGGDSAIALVKTGGAQTAYLAADGTNAWIGSSFGSTGKKFFVSLTAPDSAATLDSSGNLGLGVTPSGSWGSPALMLGKPSAGNPTYPFLTSTDTQQIVIGSNSYWDGTNWKAAFAGSPVVAMQQRINYNQISWHTASAVGQNTTQSFTQAMTLDASGNLGIGTTSPGSFSGTVKLVVGSAATTTTPGAVTVYSGTSTYGGLYFADGTVGDQLYRGAVEYNHSTDALLLYSAGSERARITSGGNFKIGGSADRATTEGDKQLVLFDGTAPVGTLANGVSFYSASGEANVMDAAGNATLLSPHDAVTNEWIFRSKHTPTGKVLKIDVERLLKFVNDHFGLDAVHEFIED